MPPTAVERMTKQGQPKAEAAAAFKVEESVGEETTGQGNNGRAADTTL